MKWLVIGLSGLVVILLILLIFFFRVIGAVASAYADVLRKHRG